MESVGIKYPALEAKLRQNPRKWLITGVAGFIGSNLLEKLLLLDQSVVGIDNFSTGFQRNIDEALQSVSSQQASRFRLVKADITDQDACRAVCEGVNVVLHQAALGSVPRSISDPVASNRSNIDGFLNLLVAAQVANVENFVFASSSSVYGDSAELPKVEERIGKPLSPYAVTKYVNELYAGVYYRLHAFPCIGLRYFNVFGRRQDPDGPYAAVIPKWFAGLMKGETVYINGDGESSRDFCYVDNVVQANLLAGCISNQEALGQVYNIACGERTKLNDLFAMIRELVAASNPAMIRVEPYYRDFLPGDVRHSHAEIGKAAALLGYEPAYFVQAGLALTSAWYQQHC